VYSISFPASGLLKSTRVRPLSEDNTLTIWPSRFSFIPFCGVIFCSWKCFVGIILTICGFLSPKASFGFSVTMYSFDSSFPIRSLSKPSGNILCPTEIICGLIP